MTNNPPGPLVPNPPRAALPFGAVMEMEFKVTWDRKNDSPRRERLALHVNFAYFSWKPSLRLHRYFKECNWLGVRVIYEGYFLKFFGKARA